MNFHDLRDTFAGTLLLRWMVAFHRHILPPGLPFLSHELFNETNIDNFKRLLQGYGNQRTHQDSFTHFMAAFAKLMGHGGPIVTLQSYTHVIDWMFYFFTRHNEPEDIVLSCRMAQDFLQVTYPTLPDALRGSGLRSRNTADFLKLQRKLVGLPKPRRPIQQKKANVASIN